MVVRVCMLPFVKPVAVGGGSWHRGDYLAQPMQTQPNVLRKPVSGKQGVGKIMTWG